MILWLWNVSLEYSFTTYPSSYTSFFFHLHFYFRFVFAFMWLFDFLSVSLTEFRLGYNIEIYSSTQICIFNPIYSTTPHVTSSQICFIQMKKNDYYQLLIIHTLLLSPKLNISLLEVKKFPTMNQQKNYFIKHEFFMRQLTRKAHSRK